MTGNVWDTAKVERFRRAAADGWSAKLDAFDVEEIKLDAAVDLACWIITAGASLRGAAEPWIERQVRRSTVVRAARAALEEGTATHRIGTSWCLRPTFAAQEDVALGEFQRDYRMELERVGAFEKVLARATAQSFGELLDNVADHSGPTKDAPARGVVGFQIVQGHTRFVVADLGRGMLASLQTNPAHAHLSTQFEALHAIVYEGASSRIGVARGNGVRQVLNSIVELQGTVRIRSVDGGVSITGNATEIRPQTFRTPAQAGTFVSVTLSRSSCEPLP